MLRLENVTAGYYAGHSVIKEVNLQIKETVAIIGQNGAGKSTLAKSILNQVPFMTGNIFFNEELIGLQKIREIVRKGIGYFVQGGQVFPHLTIEENLKFAGHTLKEKDFEERLESINDYFELFNDNGNHTGNLQASYLSGGEKHQLALAMVLINKPKFLILDEPSAGLSEKNLKNVYSILRKIRDIENVSIMLIEQNVKAAVEFSHRVAILKNGIINQILDCQNIQDVESLDDHFFN